MEITTFLGLNCIKIRKVSPDMTGEKYHVIEYPGKGMDCITKVRGNKIEMSKDDIIRREMLDGIGVDFKGFVYFINNPANEKYTEYLEVIDIKMTEYKKLMNGILFDCISDIYFIGMVQGFLKSYLDGFYPEDKFISKLHEYLKPNTVDIFMDAVLGKDERIAV